MCESVCVWVGVGVGVGVGVFERVFVNERGKKKKNERKWKREDRM